MYIITKHDIYFDLQQSLNIFQLLPIRKKWEIQIKTNEYNDVKDFVEKIEKGILLEELNMKLIQSLIVRQLFEFLQSNCLISRIGDNMNINSINRRQLEVFDSWDRIGLAPEIYQERLRKASVFVVGAGGIGTSLVSMLNSCGIGEIILADFDVVEKSNLSRQFLYKLSDIGKSKVEVLSTFINSKSLGKVIPIHERITKENFKSIISSFSKIDILTGLPYPKSDYSYELICEILECGVSILFIGEHDVGPYVKNKDELDMYIGKISEKFILQNKLIKRRNTKINVDRHPSYIPEIGMVTSIAVDEIVRYISSFSETRLNGRCISIDPISLGVKTYDL